METQFSIAICTRNRAKILQKCLDSLIANTSARPNIFIIDNNSDSKDTYELISSLSKSYPYLIYAQEMNIGLSHARNKVIEMVTSPWVVYLDDDAHVPENFIEEIDSITKNFDLSCFGGPYYATFDYGKPKWLPVDFGNKEWPVTHNDGEIIKGYLSGGLFAIKVDLLKSVGGFPVHLGMKGNLPGYGEEDYLQDKLINLGYKIYFLPSLFIYHSVLPHKFSVVWHLRQSYARGRSQIEEQILLKSIFNLIKSSIKIPIYLAPKAISKLLGSKKYYLPNAIIDTLSPFLFDLGRLFNKGRS